MSTHAQPPASDCLALPAADTAKLLGISERHLWALHSSGRLGPLPVRLGRAVRWRRAELVAWLDAGCPQRAEWVASRGPKGGAA